MNNFISLIMGIHYKSGFTIFFAIMCIMMITAHPLQMQTSLELNSLIKIANAEDEGDSGGDDKKDDKKDKDDNDDEKDDDKDDNKDDNDEKDEKDEEKD